MSKKNLDLDIILTNDTCTDLFNNKSIEHIPAIRKNPLGFYNLLKKILHMNPDIIHTTTTHPWVLIILPILKIKKIPLAVTIHDVSPHLGEASLIGKFIKYIYVKHSDLIFVHGENLKKELVEKEIPFDKITVIPHGDYSFFTRYKKGYAEEENTILFFGRILDYKGLDYLIRAENLIKKSIKNVKIMIVGEGDLTSYIDLIPDEDINNFFIVNKFIPDEQVAQFFERAKVVVLPYLEASQSGVIPIAYAFRKPLVATNVGCLSDIIDDGITGFLIPPRNVEAISQSIVTLLSDENLRKKMGDNAFIKMKNDLSWDTIADKTIDAYRVVLKL